MCLICWLHRHIERRGECRCILIDEWSNSQENNISPKHVSINSLDLDNAFLTDRDRLTVIHHSFHSIPFHSLWWFSSFLHSNSDHSHCHTLVLHWHGWSLPSHRCTSHSSESRVKVSYCHKKSSQNRLSTNLHSVTFTVTLFWCSDVVGYWMVGGT